MDHKASPKSRRVLRTVVMCSAAALALAIVVLGAAYVRRGGPDPLPEPLPTATATATPTLAPVPTPTPIPVLSLYGRDIPVTAEALDFSELESVDPAPLIDAAPMLPALRGIDLSGCSLELAALGALQAAYPEAELLCQTKVGGQPCDSRVELLDFSGGTLELSEAELACRCLPALKKLIFPVDCGYADEDLAALNEAYPDTRVVWTVRFGSWALRTDATCFSTLQIPSAQLRRYTSEEFLPLFRYCKDLVALDLGHNNLSDLTELGGLTKLKVLILADDWAISDISPLAALTELEYLEIFYNPYLEDFSALHAMTKMKDMNLSYCPLSELSFLADMPALERCWLRATNVPSQDRAAIEAQYPAVEFLWDFPGPAHSTIGGWREFDRNIAIRTAFKNWPYVEEFVSWDKVRYAEGAPIVYAQPSKS